MAIRSKEFVGIAEGIKSHELSTKGRIESLQNTIPELSRAKRSLDNQISYLEAALAAAYEDTDEDGYPDYGRIAAIESQISSAERNLSEVEGELDIANGELSQSQAELESVMEEKARTLFEIQERARKTSNNIAVAGGMYGAYSGIGSSLQSSMQTSLASLSQAASILDGLVDGFTGGGSSGGNGGGQGSIGGRGITFQGELSTSALSAFSIGNPSSVLSGNTSPASPPSNYTTEHTSGVTPATTPNFQAGQQSINPQKTPNFKTDQSENSYVISSFSEIDSAESVAQSGNYHSSQSSPNIETCFSQKTETNEQSEKDSVRGDLEKHRSWAQQYKVGFTPSATSTISNSNGASAPDKDQRELADELERGFVLGVIASKFAKGKSVNLSAFVATPPKSSKDIRNDFLRSLQTKVEPVIRPLTSTTNSSSDDDDISIGARVREKRNDRDYERGLLSKFGLGYKPFRSSSAADADIPMKPRNQILAGKNDSQSQLLNKPRSLSHTAESWIKGAGNTLIYNTPLETGKKLDIRQGKVKNFEGTCGLVSCVNVLRMAGVPITEADVVKYASTTYEENTNAFVASLTKKTLCVTNSASSLNGGTSASSRKKILEHFGIPSHTASQSIETIADAVSSGHGVIASVHAETLYFKRRPIHPDLHAITITSVEQDNSGKILGFYVCDSNAYALGGTGATYYTADELEEALSDRECNITTTIIR